MVHIETNSRISARLIWGFFVAALPHHSSASAVSIHTVAASDAQTARQIPRQLPEPPLRRRRFVSPALSTRPPLRQLSAILPTDFADSIFPRPFRIGEWRGYCCDA
jgi:hypothetical protein